MSYLNKFAAKMGMSKDGRRKIDEATSNTSLSNMRYVITEKPKWKVFRKREVVPIPAYQTSVKARKGCPCGSSSPCKQKVTPNGVIIHYPQKKFKSTAMLYLKEPSSLGHDVIKSGRNIIDTTKKTLSSFKPARKSPQSRTGFYNTSPRTGVKTIKSKKFPTWRLDKITYRPMGDKILIPRPYNPAV